VIDQVKALGLSSSKYQPNVVLINAGTNDCASATNDHANIGTRMRSMITALLAQSGWDKTVIILSTLIPNGGADLEYCRNNAAAPGGGANRQYRSLVTAMQGEGVKIVLADMDPLPPNAGSGWLSYPTDFADVTHPNDGGYKKMAYVWWKAILDAQAKGYLQAPNTIGDISAGCKKVAGDGKDVGGKLLKGSGNDDGIYYHNSVESGTLLTIDKDIYDRNQFFFARLFSKNLDDLVEWFTLADGVTVKYGVWKNMGNGKFTKLAVDMSVADNCVPRGETKHVKLCTTTLTLSRPQVSTLWTSTPTASTISSA